MADGQIRWKKGDYITLGKAISKFNKRINEITTLENKLYLPEKLEYKEVKENIVTRKELNRILKSLQNFSLPNAEKIEVLESGEKITKWERKELTKQANIAKRRLKIELKELNKPRRIWIFKSSNGKCKSKRNRSTIKKSK